MGRVIRLGLLDYSLAVHPDKTRSQRNKPTAIIPSKNRLHRQITLLEYRLDRY